MPHNASIFCRLRRAIGNVMPGPELRARQEALELQEACCALLVELVWLDSKNTEKKREAVAEAMRGQFAISDEKLASLIANAGRPENRLTSYYRPVALLNLRYAAGRKVQFIEHLWRVAMAGGEIDMYSEQLVRTLADLLYVAHADFVLARHRARESAGR
jgi:uncharacterized tellurite resistance protein B-like protein